MNDDAWVTYPVEISAPDIEPYRAGNTGIDYVTTFDSGRPGPHVMINAVTHGNEICGAITLDFLFRHGVRPTRGRLTLSFANHEAYRAFDPTNPLASRRVDEDFNRIWSDDVLDGDGDSHEIRRAREMRPLIREVDFLYDIHSMLVPSDPVMICGSLEKGRRLARRIETPEYLVSDRGHGLGRRLKDYGRFAEAEAPHNALLVECGQHWEKSTAGVAIDTTLRFLDCFDIVDPAFIAEHRDDRPLPSQQHVEITGIYTLETNDVRWARQFDGMEVIPAAGTVLGWDGENEIRTPYDDCVLVMPTRTRKKAGQWGVRFGRFAD